MEDDARPNPVTNFLGSRKIDPDKILNRLAETRWRNSLGQMRRRGRENVAAMECAANGVQEKFPVLDMAHARLLRGVNGRQQAVIGGNEEVAAGLNENRTSRRSDAWVDDNDVDRPFWEPSPGLLDGKSRCHRVEFCDFVGDVDNGGPRLDAKNNALHDAGEMVLKAEVGS